MARIITEGISARGVEVKIMLLKSYHRSDIAREMPDCGALIAGRLNSTDVS